MVQSIRPKFGIAILSDAMYPTPYEFGHGLGRAVHNVAQGLVQNGHRVTLFGLKGSRLDGGSAITTSKAGFGGETELVKAVYWDHERKNFDVALDASHTHALALSCPPFPVGAWFQDRASAKAQNPIFVSVDQMTYVGLPGKVVRNGVDFLEFTLGPGGDHAIFLGSAISHKGIYEARRIAKDLGLTLLEFGDGCIHGKINTKQKIAALRSAGVCLCPYTIDAGPQVPLEAMACGTPVVAWAKAAMPEYVPRGGGYTVKTDDEFRAFTLYALKMERQKVREAVLRAEFSVERQVEEMEDILYQLVAGRTW